MVVISLVPRPREGLGTRLGSYYKKLLSLMKQAVPHTLRVTVKIKRSIEYWIV